jgi:chromosome segregation ATPase
LDGAYGSRAERAADVSMNPAVKKEMDNLRESETSLRKQLELLISRHEANGAGSAELQNKVNNLQKELRDTIEDYELMTKASIEFEKERDHLEATIDSVRERCEALETQLSDEKVKWLGAKSNAPSETTSTMVLKNEFKKMMRDTRAENIKALRVSPFYPMCFPTY